MILYAPPRPKRCVWDEELGIHVEQPVGLIEWVNTARALVAEYYHPKQPEGLTLHLSWDQHCELLKLLPNAAKLSEYTGNKLFGMPIVIDDSVDTFEIRFTTAEERAQASGLQGVMQRVAALR